MSDKVLIGLTIIIAGLLSLLLNGCAKQPKESDYYCASNGYWYEKTPSKIKILRDKENNPLSCVDGKILEARF